MLTNLSIRNIVLIEKANIEFAKGLCVLTGETGAGKSILLDALNLTLGNRAETKLIRANADNASVTAEFHIPQNSQAEKNIEKILSKLDMEDIAEEIKNNDGTIIIRRTINKTGKSKSFINDEPISAKTLKEIGESLVEIHGQHQQRGLMDETKHLNILDSYAINKRDNTAEIIQKTAETFTSWKTAQKELQKLQEEISQLAKDKEYMEHMQKELQALNPSKDEEEKLTDERLKMMQKEKMAATINDAIAEITLNNNVYTSLRNAQTTLTRSTLKEAEQFQPAIEALEKAMIETEEAQNILETLGHECNFNQYELEQVDERLFALKDAARKYRVTVNELPELLSQVNEKLKTLDNQEINLETMKEKVAKNREEFIKYAEKLSQKRQEAATELAEEIHKELQYLKMKTTKFRVAITPKNEQNWNKKGIDDVKFEVATNKGTEFGTMKDIASGGELSRFMLALAVVLAKINTTPTMIFDEIDTGTGGAVADAIGQRLQILGKNIQVIVVTHLPQVAARGTQHLLIEKQEINKHTTTKITQLNEREKHKELARMISGAKITPEALNAASKLIETAVE